MPPNICWGVGAHWQAPRNMEASFYAICSPIVRLRRKGYAIQLNVYTKCPSHADGEGVTYQARPISKQASKQQHRSSENNIGLRHADGSKSVHWQLLCLKSGVIFPLGTLNSVQSP